MFYPLEQRLGWVQVTGVLAFRLECRRRSSSVGASSSGTRNNSRAVAPGTASPAMAELALFFEKLIRQIREEVVLAEKIHT